MLGGVIDATEVEVRMEMAFDLVMVYWVWAPESCPGATTELDRELGEEARREVVSHQWLNSVFSRCICSMEAGVSTFGLARW